MDRMTAGWLLFNAAIGGAVCFYLVSNWKTLETKKKLISLLAVFTPLHQIEEYLMPGGFPVIFNMFNDSSVINYAGYPLNTLNAMITNTVALLLVVFVIWKFSDKAWAVLFTALFGLGQLGIHAMLTVLSLELFSSAGQTLPYSPGLLTSVVLLLPLSVYCIYYLIAKRSALLPNVKVTIKTIVIAITAVMVIAGGTIMIPQITLRDPDTNLVFTNNGFYDAYLAP